MVPDKIQEDERLPGRGSMTRAQEARNGQAITQSWMVEQKRPAREPRNWDDVPLWSGLGSIVLIVAVIFFDHPSVTKYVLLFLSQILYLLSILLRA